MTVRGMTCDPRLSGYLSRALSHEMAAVQQYLLQAKLTGMWGMSARPGRSQAFISKKILDD